MGENHYKFTITLKLPNQKNIPLWDKWTEFTNRQHFIRFT